VIDAAAKLNWPICLYFHFVPDWTSLPNFSHISYVTNSLFCQRRILERFGLSSKVIRPIVLPENYQTAMDPVEVTAFSLSLIKGTDIVLDLAEALPDIPFRIFANQRTRGSEATKLLQRARGLANLRISPPVPTGGRVYQRTRVVLAPSRWEETWGRIATEAHVNDIPVLASDRGGLPEAVGPGGLCLPIDVPLTQWRDALKQLFYDEEARARMATEIGRHRASPLIDPEAITFAFVDTARACLGHLDIDAASSAAV
jgi:glycosyltransferase involved in cell wall biosynthesis